MTSNAVTTLTGSYRTMRMLVPSDTSRQRWSRCSPEHSKKLQRWSRDWQRSSGVSQRPSTCYAAAIRVLSTGSRRQRNAIGRQRIVIGRQRIAIGRQRIAIGVLRCGHPLGCEGLWGKQEEDEGTGAADGGAWERKKRVDIADWLCLHAFIIDHKKSGILFTSLLHPSRCKPTCSMRLHERSRHQRR